jgi:HAD superfamily hydrolase (TIGR01459 family)
MSPRRISGIGALAPDFDAVLLDQFGVLHDGRTAFPGALEAVAELHEAGVRLAVLSNSGKRSRANAERLAAIGFDSALFDVVVTSGEVCRQRLEEELAAGRLAEGSAVYVMASSGEGSPLAGLPLHVAERAEDASLVLVAGRSSTAGPDVAAELAPVLPLARRGVPCLCANPDQVMYADGGSAPGPGVLAEAYAAAGGPVEMIGKPHAPIFEAALAALDQPARGRTLMIGDSRKHDIAGAAPLGLATLLVEGGVQSETASDGPEPDFVTTALAW